MGEELLSADLLTNATGDDDDDRVSLTLDDDDGCLHLLAFPAARSASSLFSTTVAAAVTLSLCLFLELQLLRLVRQNLRQMMRKSPPLWLVWMPWCL